MGYNGDYEIDWNTRYATDEKEQAEIEVAHTSANVAKMQYMTVNEVRALEGLGPTEGGDEILSLKDPFAVNIEEPTGPEKQEQTRNPEGKQL